MLGISLWVVGTEGAHSTRAVYRTRRKMNSNNAIATKINDECSRCCELSEKNTVVNNISLQ